MPSFKCYLIRVKLKNRWSTFTISCPPRPSILSRSTNMLHRKRPCLSANAAVTASPRWCPFRTVVPVSRSLKVRRGTAMQLTLFPICLMAGTRAALLSRRPTVHPPRYEFRINVHRFRCFKRQTCFFRSVFIVSSPIVHLYFEQPRPSRRSVAFKTGDELTDDKYPSARPSAATEKSVVQGVVGDIANVFCVDTLSV